MVVQSWLDGSKAEGRDAAVRPLGGCERSRHNQNQERQGVADDVDERLRYCKGDGLSPRAMSDCANGEHAIVLQMSRTFSMTSTSIPSQPISSSNNLSRLPNAYA